MRHEGQIDPQESRPQLAPNIDTRSAADEASLRLRTESSTGMITKAEMTKVAGLWDWLFGKKEDDVPQPNKDGFYEQKDKPGAAARPVEPYRAEPHPSTVTKEEIKLEDPYNPSPDAVKVFEEKKAEIKQACEAAYGAGNAKCDETKPAERQGIASSGDRSSSSHNNSNGMTNALILWWLLSSNNRSTTTAPNYYDHKPSSDRSNFVGGSGASRPNVNPTKPIETHTPATNAGRNPVTGIPNVGSKPSGFGGTGGGRGSVGGGSVGGG